SAMQQTRSRRPFSPWATVAPFGTPIEAPPDFDLRARIEAALAGPVHGAVRAEDDDLPIAP
ncbi:hypothetical protein BD311DRAFT_598194, partial [Dichomitus squalens]